jgi:hypothetical protein
MRIMLAGKKGSGKDAAASFLVKQYGGYTMSFAQPLYDMMYFCQKAMGIEPYKDRVFLTTMGDYFRAINPNIFIQVCMDKAYAIAKEANVYVTDGRYENELNAGKDDGFYIIHLLAGNEVRQERRPGESITDSHSSENGFPDDYHFHFTITNDGSLEDLHKALEGVVEAIVKEGQHVIF